MSAAARGGLLEGALFLLAGILFALGHGFAPWEAAPYAPGEPRPGILRVVTWNVGGADGERMHLLRTEDVDAVVASLVALGPDLVLLQEVGSGSRVEDLLARLREADRGEWAGIRGRGGVCALIRGGIALEWRAPLAARRAVGLRMEVEGAVIEAAGIHAHAFSAEERNGAVGALLEALLARPADLHVFAGDLNLDLDLDKRRDLFTDDEHLDVETYNFVAGRLDDAARGRGATAEPDRRLDYVFVSPRARIEGAGPWKGRRVGSMDHDPVVLDVALP